MSDEKQNEGNSVPKPKEIAENEKYTNESPYSFQDEKNVQCEKIDNQPILEIQSTLINIVSTFFHFFNFNPEKLIFKKNDDTS